MFETLDEKPQTQVIQMKTLGLRAQAHGVTAWRCYSFAPEWFEDAKAETQRAGHDHSPRREILFAVCCVESYLFEWVRDEVLDRDFSLLYGYFGDKHKREGIGDRWKRVIRELMDGKKIPNVPDFGDATVFGKFARLVDYRNGLVHGSPSRPETAGAHEAPQPMPSKAELDALPPGWAVKIVIDVITALHKAVGTTPPVWLTEPPYARGDA